MNKESESLQNLFRCCVCDALDATSLFSFCFHAVCDECIEKVKSVNGYCCVKCLKTSDKLIGNGALSKLTSQNIAPNCLWCDERGEINISQGHCKECNRWLCSECIKGHNRMPTFRSHTIDVVRDFGDRGLMCEVHPQETLELYCETCGVLTCRNCQLSLHRDHGGHRWVKEKAELLRSSLVSTAVSMETRVEKLRSFIESIKNSPADIRASVEDAKASYRQVIGDLIRIAKTKEALFDVELDKTAKEHLDKLSTARDIMQNLADRIDHALHLARFLVENESKDPASLVQLAGHIEDQLRSLAIHVDQLSVSDTSAEGGEFEEDLKGAFGWQKASAARVHFLPIRSPTEAVNSVSSLFWSTYKEMNGNISLNHDHSNGENLAVPLTNGVENMEIDTSGERGDSILLSGGCAVCHSFGLLLICSACSRTFHPHCHLPRLDISDISEGQLWTCSLCSFDAGSSSSGSLRRVRDTQNGIVEKSQNEISWTHEQFKSGCRILLNILCRPEATCFTSSTLCPICSCDLSIKVEDMASTGAENSFHDLCVVFHGLAQLRQCLELSETNGGRSIEQWIRDIDTFTVDTCSKSDDFGVPSISETFRKAACSLRDALDSCVASHYPAFFQA